MNTSNKPISEIIKNSDVDEPKKRTREDWRKAKELEEARKAGTAPAAVDEEGKDINPHIPQYISSAPWYFGSKGPTLKHQRPQPEKQKEFNRIEEFYIRGLKTQNATRYRKGACENCGALTHKKKDCLERPRKVGAKFSGDDIAPDESVLPELKLDYDGKRDRWNGFDAVAYQAIVDEYEKVEEAKRQLKEEKLKQDMMSGETNTVKEHIREGGSDDDEDKYADDADMPGTKVDSKQRITVRNLRIREDIAKYLRNLDPNSAYYDPKTRSMRDNPYKNAGHNDEDLPFSGDNFVRFTGDTTSHAKTQLFAWQAYEKGIDVHLQSEPTKAELLHKEFKVKKEEFKHSMKDNILEKYGGAEHLQLPPKELIFAQSEHYVEYSRHGQILKGDEKPLIRSRYEEDIFVNNHTSVWGSYWHCGSWGYKCCHSMVKQSYCTGEVGKSAFSQAQRIVLLPPEGEETEGSVKMDDGQYREEARKSADGILQRHESPKKDSKIKKAKSTSSSSSGSSSSGSSSEESDDDSSEDEDGSKKLKKALEAEEENQRAADRILAQDERKRPYNSMFEVKAPTEEEMEAYFMKRARTDDPMAGFLGNN